MCEDLRIVIHPDSFQDTESSPATGIIYWQIGDFEFPAGDWYDFVLVVLNWWLDNLLGLFQGTLKTAEMDFMDGPFLVRIEQYNATDLALQFYDRGKKTVMYECHVTMASLGKAMVSASQEAIDGCAGLCVTDGELSGLRRRLNKLRTKLT